MKTYNKYNFEDDFLFEENHKETRDAYIGSIIMILFFISLITIWVVFGY